MTPKLIWETTARNDLDEIAGWIALDRPAAARRIVQSIMDRVDVLAAFPRSGRVVPELAREDREAVVPYEVAA